MKLMSIELLKAKRRSADKRNKKALQSKKMEYKLELELIEKLEQQLEDNESVMIEVNPRVAGEFINILNGKILNLYEYKQVDKNKFVFYNKEIVI